MSEPSIGIVGGGRVARILLAGWARANRTLSRIVVSDIDAAPLALLRTESPSLTVTEDNSLAARQTMVDGAASTMMRSRMPPEAVIDLIPVKPLASLEPTVRDAYARVLGALHGKLKG